MDHLRALAVGDRADDRVFGPVTRTDIVRYAGASGDFNPIHHDEAFAQSAGFPTVFAMGMYPAALLATFVTDWLGAENVRRFTVRFRDQVWPGDMLTCSASVTAAEPRDEYLSVAIEFAGRRQTGGVAVIGNADFLIPCVTSARATANPQRKGNSWQN